MPEYTQMQRDNVIRLMIEMAKGAAERVGVRTTVNNCGSNGDVVLTFLNPGGDGGPAGGPHREDPQEDPREDPVVVPARGKGRPRRAKPSESQGQLGESL